MDSLNSEYYLNRGYCYREINIDKSITDITNSILLNNRLGKNNSTNYAFRFSEYFYAGRFKKCLSDLSEKIKLDRTMPNESLNYFYRSLCYFYLKDFDNAIKDAEKSNSLDVSKPNIIWLIKLYIADSKYDKALSLLDSYKERKADPGKAYYHYIRGILNEQLGYSNLAAVDFRKSVILKGKYKYDITFYPAIELGFIYYKNKSIDSSLKYIKESIGEGFCDFNNPKIKMMEQNKRIRTYIKNYKKSSKYLSQLKSEEEINEILKRGKIMNEKELEKVSSISTGALPLKENLDNCIRLNKLVWQYQML
jgi:tetratricopeptide (TPR) repeat protein